MTAGTAEHDQSHAGQVFAYFAPLTLLVYLALPQNYFLDIATTYMLKDHLHASADQVSMFRLLTAVPVYLSVVFGMTRDLWNPLGLRDRGYFFIFAPATAIVFVWMALSNLSYAGLFAGMFLVMLVFRFVQAAYAGLLALIGQEKLMTGRLTVVWQVFNSLPTLAGAFAGGWISVHMAPRQTFFLAAVLAALIAVFALWKPRVIFSRAYDRPEAKGSDLWGDIKRLVRHRPAWLAVLIFFMFQFAPGMNTPLQFYLTNVLHASDATYGYFLGIFAGAFIPVFLLYGYLCKRVSLKKLLWWGTVITVPQMVPLAFIHSAQMAVILAAPIGAMGGIAAASYFDLTIRACPPGLQGTLMMLVDGIYVLSTRGGDLVGAQIYSSSPEHGFLYCVIATSTVYALILPVLLLIPKDLISTTDGQANPAMEGKVER